MSSMATQYTEKSMKTASQPDDEETLFGGDTFAPRRHHDYWYRDGSVVLVVGSFAFCVHEGILSEHSPVLKNIIAGGSQVQNGLTEEYKKPVIYLSDSPTEFKDFLDVIYHGLRYRKGSDRPEWSVVRAMLRLGTKYEVTEHKEEAINQLNHLYPTDIEDRDALYHDKPHMAHSPEDSIAMANLIRPLGVPHIHLSALYECCQPSVDVLIKGVQCPDGTIEKLCDDDLKNCMEGRELLALANYRHIETLFSVLPPMIGICESANECASTHKELSTRIRADCDRLISHNPLDGSYWIEDLCDDEDVGMCEMCIGYYVMKYIEGRQKILEQLDQFFQY